MPYLFVFYCFSGCISAIDYCEKFLNYHNPYLYLVIFYIRMSNTISRVLYQTIIYLGLLLPAGSSNLPGTRRAAVSFLFGLASDGVYTAISVTRDAVSSYLTFSPLPENWRFFSVALAWESPPPDVIRHPALRSPDFPRLRPFGTCSRDCLCYSNVL